MENYLKGKRVLFMGDSITARYMGECGWPKYFSELLEPSHTACVAVSGARWRDSEDTVYDGNPIHEKGQTEPNNVMGNQVEKLKLLKGAGNQDFENFDVIIMAAGTNDGSTEEDAAVTSAQFVRDGEYIPLSEADRKTWGGALRYVSESLHELYPEAIQFICTPIQGNEQRRTFEGVRKKGELLKSISARLSVRCIDMINCGIYGRYEIKEENGRSLIDGLHPNPYGARQMGFYIAMAVKSFLG